MAKDEHLFTIYENDDNLWPFHSSVYPYGYAYLMSWPLEDGTSIVKVGESWAPRRWRAFISRGASIELIVRAPASNVLAIERELTSHLAAHHQRAFELKADAAPYLGNRGSGWLECFVADPKTIVDVLRSIVRRENDALVQSG